MNDAPGQAVERLERLLRRRHSCRAFLPDPLPDGTIDHIVRIAGLAPSWCNAQPWAVHIAEGDQAFELGARLHTLASDGVPTRSDLPFPAKYLGVYRERRIETAVALYEALGVHRDDIEGRTRQVNENHRFFGAPHVMIVSTPRDLGVYGVLDCGAFITLALTAAEALGVAAIAQAGPSLYSDELRRALGIAEDRDIVAAISLGWEDVLHPANQYRVRRAAPEAVLTRVTELAP